LESTNRVQKLSISYFILLLQDSALFNESVAIKATFANIMGKSGLMNEISRLTDIVFSY